MRSIKPEMFRSLTVSSWPRGVRWTFAGLLTYLDDAGRGLDDTRLIKAEVYPVDDDMTPRKIDRELATIAANGPLCRYEVAGRRYLHIVSWQEHQRINRPTRSRMPPCPIHESSVNGHGELPEPSNNPQPVENEGSQPSRAPAEHGSREQGNKGAGDARADAHRVSPPPPKTPNDEPPPARCAKHRDAPAPGPCGPCADARRTRQAWDDTQAEHRAALAAELERARADPRLRCNHGTDGGLHRRSDTGESPCAQCRAAQRKDPA